MNDTANQSRRVCYVVSNELVKVSSLLPSNRNRSLLVHSLVKEFGLLNAQSKDDAACAKPLRPSPADLKDLSAYHDRDYLDHLLNGVVKRAPDQGKDTEYGLEEDCPSFAHLPEYVRLVAGASLSAARALREDQADIAICWDGGRHHAQKAQASGFCYVADCVLAILALKRALPPTVAGPARSFPSSYATPNPKPRVMYLDLDLHFSDGVSQAFYAPSSSTAPPQVLTLSIHHAAPGFFPASALAVLSDPTDAGFDPFTLSLPLERGAANGTFRRVWRQVERVRDAFVPDYVVVQCGVDGLAGDPYATWNWALGPAATAEEVACEGGGGGEGSLGWCIARVCRWGCKTLLLGGYNSPNVARAWTYLTSVALGRPLALDADIPDHAAFPLYAPSFTLDVPAGNIQDQNTDVYLAHVEHVFDGIVEALSARMRPASSDAPSRADSA
ncbi:histone deacetylase complex protein [Daedaleopsis nitida]|nr:histone deacetylase complex protein [Daedaleopsis nitida]